MKAFRLCARCHHDRLVEGGVEIAPGRWLCASCWVKYLNRKTAT